MGKLRTITKIRTKIKLLEYFGFDKIHSGFVKEDCELRFGLVDALTLPKLREYLEEYHEATETS